MVVFALNWAVATPVEPVCTVMVLVPLLNVPDAPLAGAVKTTLTPDTGLPLLSVTFTANGLGKAVLMAALCGVEFAYGLMATGTGAALPTRKT